MPSPDSAALLEATASNTSFSTQVPGLQIAMDSTSLGEFKKCPRSYYYSIILGYQPRTQSVHLAFGILMHGARERYDHWRFGGASHQEALEQVVAWVLAESWDRQLGRPMEALSGHKSKNRFTLVRTVVWYLDEWGENDPIHTLKLANGKPAVELSFSFPAGANALSSGEPFLLCGHLDRLGELDGQPYVIDTKSTEHIIDAGWLSRFSPDNQFSLYTLAGRLAFGFSIQALIVDGVQVAAGFSRCQRGLVQRTEAQCEEWLTATHWWLRSLESCAVAGDWPMNDKSCGLYGGCQFREICAKPPSSRQMWLDSGFARRVWDPLQRRGDV
jgi:hypothetical protein